MDKIKSIRNLFINLSLALTSITIPGNIQPKQETWVNVFVHGIMGIRPHLTPSNIIRFMIDDVKNTKYSLAVEIMRNDPIFYEEQAMQEIGFHSMNSSSTKTGYAAGAMAYAFDQISKYAYPEKKIKNLFYTFGWSGLSSRSERKKAGIELYHILEKKINELRMERTNPKIRIIGYSHGGNVILNLGSAHDLDYTNHTFNVDELILLGTPIQCETDYLIRSKLFRRIYNFYSRVDQVQIMDCFSYKRFFSNKLFKSRTKLKLPSNVRQVQIRVTDPIRRKRKKNIDTQLPNMNNRLIIHGSSQFLRDRSPGHGELWFFGWTPTNYRNLYPLYPLPTIAMTPYIVKYVELFIEKDEQVDPTKSIIVDLRPHWGHAIVRKERNATIHAIHPIVTKKQINTIGEALKAYHPTTTLTKTTRDQRIRASCEKAQLIHKKERTNKKKKPRNHKKR